MRYWILIILIMVFWFNPAFAKDKPINQNPVNIALRAIAHCQQQLGMVPQKGNPIQQTDEGYLFQSLGKDIDPVQVQALFKAKINTVDKKIIFNKNDKPLTFSMRLENQGRTFKQEVINGNAGDTLVYSNKEDIITYQQAQDKNGDIELKEWIYAAKPNKKGGSLYQWHFTQDKDIKAVKLQQTPDGGVMVYVSRAADQRAKIYEAVKKAMGSLDTQQWYGAAQIPPSVYFTREGLKKTANMTVKDNVLTIDIREPKDHYPLVIDPNLRWGQWLGGTADDLINSVAVNGTAIYAGGTSSQSASWEVAMSGTFSGGSEGFVVKLTDNGGTPTVVWGQWLGGTSDDVLNAVAVNGTAVYAGGYVGSSASFDLTPAGTFQAGPSAYIVKITDDGASPTIAWGQWLDAQNTDELKAIAVNGTAVYAAGYANDSAGAQIVYQGTYGGSAEGWVVKMTDNGNSDTLDWGHWVGAASLEQFWALTVNGTAVYAAGYTNSTSSTWEVGIVGTMRGASEAMIVKMTDNGATSTVNWIKLIGSTGSERLVGIQVNGTTLYIGGYTTASASTEIAFNGTYQGSADSFVAKITDNGASATLNWGQWLGGTGSDQMRGMSINGTTIYASGYSTGSASWQLGFAGTFRATEEGWLVSITDKGTYPTWNWAKWLAATNNDRGQWVAVNGTTLYVGGYSTGSANWDFAFNGTYSGGTTGQEAWMLKFDAIANDVINFGTDF